MKQIQNYQKNIIDNFDKEISNFKQVCPKEMIDKLRKSYKLKAYYKRSKLK